jgi:4-amino-4-deoxy-L-arabinose transferase-like glycosyltransferase
MAMPSIAAATASIRYRPYSGVLRALRSPLFVPVCLLVAAVLRGVVILVPVEQTSDFDWYFGRAAAIGRGEGYHHDGVPTAFWPVGWPAALGLLFAATGTSALAGKLANLAMGMAACWMAADIARRHFGGREVAGLVALIMAAYPNQVAYVPLLSTEIFYQALLLGAVLLLMRERPACDLACGLLLGVATLTKTQTLPMPGLLLLAVILLEGRATLARRLRTLLRVYAVLLLVVAPWSYRNWTVLHEVVPVSTNGGWTLLSGNNPEARGDYTPATVLAEGYSFDPRQQVAMDHLARERAVEWIRANPGRFLMLMPLKVFRLWAPDGEAEWFYQAGSPVYEANAAWFRVVRGFNQLFYLGVLALAATGAWRLWRTRATVTPWAWAGVSFCLYFTLVSVVFSGQSRFHFALMPFVIGYAAWALAQWLAAREQRRRI